MTKLTKLEEEIINEMHKVSKRNAYEAERILREKPYVSRGQDFTHTTILNCWRRYGLEIRGRGGPNTLGKHWTCKQH